MTPSERAAKVNLVVLDVDGVLTDGGLWYGPDGETLKRFDVKDGHGLVLARETGLPVAWLTARSSAILTARAKELKIEKVLQGRRDKTEGLSELCKAFGVPLDQTAYMGDDLNDLAPLRLVGLAACPADAVEEVRTSVQYIASKEGGRGAVREFLELILRATGRWQAALDLK
jgi:3-deoxy-D-manno-octulosonate 8-phosphate phosphatase (KDO 8-P phosphatase)